MSISLTTQDTATIAVRSLSKDFGRIKALADVSLVIGKGELFGLLGPNGAGKTTLISILSTILPPSRGEALVCGWNVATQQEAVRRSIGVVFQDPSLDTELTGEENLDFHGRLYGLDTLTRRNRVNEVLALVDLEERRHDLVNTYSGGMRRRLEIARGLMHQPQVLFLDEPTLGLDPQTRRRIWNYIRSLKDSFGMTIILTTHYMEEADQLCSRIAIIDSGVIVGLGSPDELKSTLGGDVLELAVTRPTEEFVQSLRSHPSVRSVLLQNGSLMLTVDDGESFLPRTFDLAHDMGIRISGVSVRKPNLEDVFIKMTGREIRDEGIKEPRERMRIYRWGMRK